MSDGRAGVPPDVLALRAIIRRREDDWYLDEDEGLWCRYSPGRVEREAATEEERRAFSWVLES